MELLNKYKQIIEQIAPDLEQFKQEICMKIVQSIPDRGDRDEAVSLARKVFNVEIHQNSPEEYQAGLKRLNEILSKYGSCL